MLEALADLMENKYEVKSGENALLKIDQFNTRVQCQKEPEFTFSQLGTVSEIDIPESQIIQFHFEAPEVIEEAEKEVVHGYETDEEEFKTREEVGVCGS